MPTFPETVQQIIALMTEKHGDDIPAAVREAESKIRKLKDFPNIVDMLLRSAIQELIYNCRCSANRSLKRRTKHYGGPAKVVAGKSKAVQQAATDCYTYYIAGRMLGQILGKELPDIARSEESVAAGHSFNAALCRRLATLVPSDKRVSDVVSNRKLKTLFKEVNGKIANEAA